MKSIIVARVSTDDQKETSPVAQLFRMRSYCKNHKFDEPQEFNFTESAYKNKRDEFDKIIDCINNTKEKVALANPMSYVSKSTPNFLIFHGNKDPLVPHCQSEKLFEKLQSTGVKSELVIVDGGGHGPGVMIDKYYVQMIAYFKNQIKK